MSKKHLAGFVGALVVTAAPYLSLVAATSFAPASRGNPAVATEAHIQADRVAAPAVAAHVRRAVA